MGAPTEQGHGKCAKADCLECSREEQAREEFQVRAQCAIEDLSLLERVLPALVSTLTDIEDDIRATLQGIGIVTYEHWKAMSFADRQLLIDSDEWKRSNRKLRQQGKLKWS